MSGENLYTPLDGAAPGGLTLFIEGDDLYTAMREAIEGARRHIAFETYILAHDETGKPLMNALAEKAEAGVDVRLHVDAFGSLGRFPRSAERQLRRRGVKVRRFHRWSWRDPLRYNRRNHRKLLVVDSERVFLGGFNVHREYSRSVYGMQRWRDTHLHMQGELAGIAQILFDSFWRGDWSRPLPAAEHGSARLLSNHTRRTRRELRRFFDRALEEAKRSVWFTSPYFVPDLRMQRRFVGAARRGVDVRVLVPGKNDIRLVQWASRAAYATLLAAGVRIFEYMPRVLHAKTAVIDGEWATVGTSNLDYRSFLLNYEVNLLSRDEWLCGELANQFLSDLKESVEIKPDKWSRRQRLARVAEAIGWLARRWL